MRVPLGSIPTEDEIAAFLIGWLMEFGDRNVPAVDRAHNRWYQKEQSGYVVTEMRPYIECSSNNSAVTGAKISQEGLDFLKKYRGKK